jgi:hypothetical protein
LAAQIFSSAELERIRSFLTLASEDTISSFDLSKDVLAFDQNLFANVAAILANTTTNAKMGYAVITYDSADTVPLNGITKANLSSHLTDFHIL